MAKSAEISDIFSMSELDAEDRICYPFMIDIGPRLDLDIVSVANQVRRP